MTSDSDLSPENARESWWKRAFVWKEGINVPTALLAIIIAVFGSYITNSIQNRETRLMREQAAFVDEARTFDVVIASYVQNILDGKPPSAEATQLVIGNIVKQNALLDQIYPSLSPNSRRIAREYKELLVAFRDDVPSATSPIEMRPFWEGASRVLVTRNTLISTLQH